MSWKSPVVMIGIDAACWEVIDPLVAAGRLPNIARLLAEGSWGPSRSLPYTSPALWTSISTGKLPEKHGVLDFYSATRHHVRSLRIYDIMEGAEGRVGLFRWFATWPPVANAGFTVPSPIARTRETYPPQLKFINDLTNPSGLGSYLTGGLRLVQYGGRLSTLMKAVGQAAYEVATRPEERDLWYRRRLAEAAIHGDLFAYLIRRHHPQFAAILFSLVDDLGHRYWKYREPELFEGVSQSDVRRYGGVIDAGYVAADRALGVIMRAIPDDALIVIVSDHGQKAGPPLVMPYNLSQKALTLLGVDDTVWMTIVGYRAYLRARSEGDPGDTLEQLEDLLSGTRLKGEGKPVFEVSREQNRLVVRVALDAVLSADPPVTLPGGGETRLNALVSNYGEISGHHSDWGIFILKGPGVLKGHRVEGASLLDVTPTLLALRGMPVGRDMDGKVVVAAIEEEFLEQNPVRYCESYETETRTEEDVPFTGAELEDLEERLRSLGYLG